MKKILCFDSWTLGSHHFARLIHGFDTTKYQLILLHIGSWGHDKNRPLQETISGLIVRDIKYYSGLTFNQILKKEKPAAVIFLSTRALAHMAFLRYCYYNNIPSCHLYHGLIGVQAINSENSQPYRVNFTNQITLLINRVFKNSLILIPVYIKSLLYTSSSFTLWKSLFSILYTKILGKNINKYLPGTETTIGCVYTSADTDHMTLNYNIPKAHVSVVGNPDLITFGLDQSDLASALEIDTQKVNEVIYIDTALVPSGLVFSSNKEYHDYLVQIKDGLLSQGFRLVVKLHPAQLITQLPEMLKKSNIDICESHEFKNRLIRSSAVFAEPSTAAMIPALLGVPIFLVRIGPLSSQNYGEVLTSYPLMRQLVGLKNFHEQLNELNKKYKNGSNSSLDTKEFGSTTRIRYAFESCNSHR